MKKLFLILTTFIVLITVFSSIVLAQGMMNWVDNSTPFSPTVSSTAQDENKGKQIWNELQTKQINCNNLKDDDFELLGEYFMDQSIGNIERHAAMNQMMQNMMGQNGEEQIHVTLGKRSSGCDTNASFPTGYSFMPMMWMMGGWGGFGLGWLSMLLFWSILILGVIVLIRYLTKSEDKGGKTPLDILKERYAKGEIDKKEFEDKKKDLSL